MKVKLRINKVFVSNFINLGKLEWKNKFRTLHVRLIRVSYWINLLHLLQITSKMKTKSLTFFFFFFSLVSYCQTKLAYDVYYFKNPNHIIKAYNNILVFTNAAPNTKKLLIIAAKKANRNVTFANDLFPPIRNYSDEEIREVIKNKGFDAILYYTIKGTTVHEVGTYGSYTMPSAKQMGTFYSTTQTKSYTSIEAAIVEPDTKGIYEIYYYGGASGNSKDVTYRVFKKILMRLESTGIAFAPAE